MSRLRAHLGSGAVAFDVEAFLAERTPRWRRLELLLDQADALRLHELGTERVQEIVSLYRQAASDLNRARSLTASPELLVPLNALVGRGYRFVHGRRVPRPWKQEAARFFGTEAPRTVRRHVRDVAACALALVLGALVGAGAVLVDASWGERLVPGQFWTESPRERVERIESAAERIDSLEKALTFGATLYTHNMKVGLLAFSLGALTLAGAHLIIAQNGVILGAVAASYHAEGVGLFFSAWVGPHAALEIPAIVLSGAAGAVIGRALLFPRELTRAASIRLAAPPALRILATAGACFVVAGLVEGSISQMTARTVPHGLKIAFATVLFGCLVAWLAHGGRRSEAGLAT